jgi:hypothetical protein
MALATNTLLGFVVVPRVARSLLEKQLTKFLDRGATIGRISLNPFTLAVTLDQVAVRDRDGGPFLAFDQLFMKVEAASLIKGGIVVRDLYCAGPR